MNPVDTILVFRVGQLGDSVASLPAVRAIRAAHADARLILLTDRQSTLQAVSAWDVLGPTGVFDDAWFVRVPGSPVDYVKLALRLRTLRPSRLYYLPPMPRSALQIARDRLFFSRICGIADIRGLRPTGAYPIWNADRQLVPTDPEWRRLFDWVAHDLPGVAEPEPPRIEPRPRDRRHVDEILASAGFSGRQLIAIGAGSKMQAKTWPEDRFVAVGRELLRADRDLRLVVLGAPHERALGDRLCAAWGPAAINLSGELAIWETAAVLERCCAYIGNDTGTMHVAASVGTRCIAIFSARDNPGKWDPAGRGHIVLRAEVPCAGCQLETCVDRQRACLMAIEPSDVLAAAAACLRSSDAREGLRA